MNTRLSSVLPASLPTTLSILAILLAPTTSRACSIPVFRYALQFWEPDAFEALVFHRGKLGEEDAKALEKLSAAARGPERANVNIQTVDLDDEDLPEALQELWKRQASAGQKSIGLPHVVSLYPESYGPAVVAESVALSEFRFDHWTTSPARKTITERLARGDSAVWVLLEIGDEKKDAAAKKTLQTTLAKLEKTLELPEQLPDPDVLFEPEVEVQAELRLAFSSLVVSRDDPAEKHLVSQLLHSESDLLDFEEPMVFAVFGRGRALPALVGAGINEDVISEVAAFLTGPCSCQVKAQNPGFDLLIAADWETLLMKANAALSEEAPVSGGAEPQDDARIEASDGAPAAAVASPASGKEAGEPTATSSTIAANVVGRPTESSRASGEEAEDPAATASEVVERPPESSQVVEAAAPASPEEPDGSALHGPMLKSILVVVFLGLAALVIGTAIILKQSS